MTTPKRLGRPRIRRPGFNLDGTPRKEGSGGARAGGGRPVGSKNKRKKGEQFLEILADAGIDGYETFIDYWRDPDVPRKDKVALMMPYVFSKEVQRQEIDTTVIKIPKISILGQESDEPEESPAIQAPPPPPSRA